MIGWEWSATFIRRGRRIAGLVPFAGSVVRESRAGESYAASRSPVVAEYLAKMQTEAARSLYRLRAPVAEFSNLWLKAKLGLRQFAVRGLRKVRCEVLWACLTYNIQQWYRLRWKVGLQPAES